MGIYEIWEIIKANLDFRFDENSKEFKDALAKRNLEVDKVVIPFYSSPDGAILQVKEEMIPHYLFIDKNIYNGISRILSKVTSQENIDKISSVLKVGYYKSIHAEINTEILKQNEAFEKDFLQLSNFLNKDITYLKLQTDFKKDRFENRNPLLLQLFKAILINSFNDEEEINEYLFELTNRPSIGAINLSDYIINITAINLLDTLNMEGILADIDSVKIFQGKYSNKQCDLVYDLLEAGQLINFNDEINSPKKDYIRSRLMKHFAKIKNTFSFK